MGRAAWALLWLLLGRCGAQYEKYSFRGFPPEDLMPLAAAYGHALEQYEGEGWRESARYLEAALRLHRLLRDSEAFCHANCSGPAPPAAAAPGPPPGPAAGPGDEWARELRLFGRVLERAACLRRCKRTLPAFQVPYPPRQLLRDFQSRLPYQYLHYAQFKVGSPAPQPPASLPPAPGAARCRRRQPASGFASVAAEQLQTSIPQPLVRSGRRARALLTHPDPTPQANRLEKALAAAYTFLQKNPKHELTTKYLSYYRGMLDAAEEPLTDLEAQPYEVGGGGGLALKFLPNPPYRTWGGGECGGGAPDPALASPPPPGRVPPGGEALQQRGLPRQHRGHGARPGRVPGYLCAVSGWLRGGPRAGGLQGLLPCHSRYPLPNPWASFPAASGPRTAQTPEHIHGAPTPCWGGGQCYILSLGVWSAQPAERGGQGKGSPATGCRKAAAWSAQGAGGRRREAVTSQEGLGWGSQAFQVEVDAGAKVPPPRWETAPHGCPKRSLWPEVTPSLKSLTAGAPQGCPELFNLGVRTASTPHLPPPREPGCGHSRLPQHCLSQPPPLTWLQQALQSELGRAGVLSIIPSRNGAVQHTTSFSPLLPRPAPQIFLQNPCSARWTVRPT